jgi:hypothetical protein
MWLFWRGGSRNTCMLFVRKTERKRSLVRTKRRRHVNFKMNIEVGWEGTWRVALKSDKISTTLSSENLLY